MGSPAVFSGRRTKLLTPDGLLTSTGQTIDFNGPRNYIANNAAEVDTAGWATYADAAASSPVDGTGGSPSSTFTRSTTSPLVGSASFVWTKSAANRQGEGFSYDFSIQDADKGKVLACSLDYSILSGTFSSGDMTFWIFDITNAVLIQPAPYSVQNHTLISDRFFIEFQTSYNSNSYRLICHTSTVSASAYTLKFDNFLLGPQAKLYGSPITDWVSYTPIFTGFGTVASQNLQWRKNGSDLEVRGTFTPGSATAVEARMSLPFSLTSLSTLPTLSIAGMAHTPSFGTAGYINNQPVLIEPSVGYVTFQTPSTSTLSKTTGSAAFGALLTSLEFKVPIQGWSSSQLMSSDASTRVVSFSAYKNGGSFTSGAATTSYTAVSKDSVGGFNSTTGLYTIQVPGDYYFTGQASTTSAAGVRVAIQVNGSTAIVGNLATSTNIATVSYLAVGLKAGDTVNHSTLGTSPLNSDNNNIFQGYMIQGPAQIAASETVSMKYTNTAGTTINTSDTVLPYPTKLWDSHGSYNTGTGLFTAPVSGKYLVNAKFHTASLGLATTTPYGISLFKNGASYDVASFRGNGGTTVYLAMINQQVDLLAGETIGIYASAGAATTANTTAGFNTLSITRIGNY
jgi:hypothetical protein